VGQPIEVETERVGDVAIFDTDRSISGQDGESFTSRDTAEAGTTFPARLALRLFDSDPQIAHIYIFSNTISVRRTGGWTEEALAAAAEVVRDFFVFYEKNRGRLIPG
jgi:hypothetical protein